MEINGAAQTVVTSGVIFAALVLLGRWIFEWFAKRVEEKDQIIHEMAQQMFAQTAASTQALNDLVRTNSANQEKIIERLEGCPLRGAT